MNIRIEDFEDTSEKNADGLYDYSYSGKIYYFEEGDNLVIVRAYSDTPDEAAFMSFNHQLFHVQTIRHPYLKQVATYLKSVGFTYLKILNSDSNSYEDFPNN